MEVMTNPTACDVMVRPQRMDDNSKLDGGCATGEQSCFSAISLSSSILSFLVFFIPLLLNLSLEVFSYIAKLAQLPETVETVSEVIAPSRKWPIEGSRDRL